MQLVVASVCQLRQLLPILCSNDLQAALNLQLSIQIELVVNQAQLMLQKELNYQNWFAGVAHKLQLSWSAQYLLHLHVWQCTVLEQVLNLS